MQSTTVSSTANPPQPGTSGPTQSAAAAQPMATSTIEITSSADGAVVHPGETITVSLATSPANVAVQFAALMGEGPLGTGPILNSLPAKVSIVIPKVESARTYMLTAVGVTTTRQRMRLSSILLDVEPSDPPTSLATELNLLTFESQGEEAPIQLLGKFSDGSTMEVTESSNVTYASMNTDVVTVSKTGTIKAVATGEANVTASYHNSAGEIVARTNIRCIVLPLIVSASPAALNFDNTAVGTSNSQKLTISNSGKSDLSVVSVTTGGEFSETDDCVASSPIIPGGTCLITVTFKPATPGPKFAVVTVNTNETFATSIDLHSVGVR